MVDQNLDVLLLSVGADLPYFTGYEAMPLERLTMLVVPKDGDATLVIPRLEAPRVTDHAEVFSIRSWDETDDPLAIVASLIPTPERAAIGNQTWAQFLVGLFELWPTTSFAKATDVTGPLRAVKDEQEMDALRAASAAADRVATQLQTGDIALIGRTEAEVSNDIGRRLLAEGHHRVNFAIVAAGENAASPHHEPGSRVIKADEVVLCDFGGTWPTESGPGYCSDITRCVYTGAPPAEFRELYDVLLAAQVAGVAGATIGTTCEAIDATPRSIIAEGGYGEFFIHRTGHGIGIEAHEDPYIVSGNITILEAGHAFSVEPGIYIPERWGARLEDIVLATEAGPEQLNHVEHDLVVVEA